MTAPATTSDRLPDERSGALVARLVSSSLRALPGMYLTDQRLFGWCIRRGPGGDALEGTSHRYSAMVLIGLAAGDADAIRAVFPEAGADPCASRLIEDLPAMSNLGDVALVLWAASDLGRPDTRAAFERLRAMNPGESPCPTVELAWALTALCRAPDALWNESVVTRVADRLMRSFVARSALFPHWPVGAPSPWRRRHVACFADWVYPVQALAQYHARTGDERAGRMARASAERMCALQGPGGQWWWHYDVRTGRVVEQYPVYAVHQDAMAPMALFDAREACGVDFGAAITRGLDWLEKSPERGDSLIDDEVGLIWRKVCRREPGKWSRALQAAASRAHPALRVPVITALFSPTAIDHECRPYHLGWLLYAFGQRRWPNRL